VATGGAATAGGSGGSVTAGNGGVVPPPTANECADAKTLNPGPSPVRRLNRFEYNNTIADLLGDDSAPANEFPLEEQSSFDNDATVLRVSRLLAESYLASGEQLAKTALGKATTLPCAATAAGGDMAAQEQCAGTLIDSLGGKAFRRPVAAAEKTRLLGVFRSARAFLDFQASLSTLLETLLSSPQFLYRIESGTPVEGSPGILRVDPWGLASRLSFFLWGSMPDSALLQAAQDGRLVTPADVRREAERMYGSPRSRVVVRHFTRHWLELTTVDQQGKDAKLFPDYTPAIGTLMRTQTETFAEHLYFDGAGTVSGLLSAPYTFMNQPLAKFLGVTGPASDKFERVELDPAKSAGVLTQPAFLSYNATVDRTHPILRGVFVMRKLLCSPPPSPPPGLVDGTDNAHVENPTQRERLAAHRTSDACLACHQLIDPIGLSFENFDAVGRWRDNDDNGLPVDATGGLSLTDVDGPVLNAVELTKKLAQSAQVQKCVTVDWFRYANGRGESVQDSCSILKVADSLQKSGGELRELLLSQTQTDAFLYRSEVKP
jgi:Protein of unknown function (DUF1592)/Protein of unknown function (DUF1588)/Protein of unknown function (DUF1587)/Protein of unknown function (DUF1595)/Protein of unknown function (DUF1585)